MGDDKSALDKANDGMGGINAAYTGVAGGYGAYSTAASTGALGLANREFGVNDLLRPLGLNYDEYKAPGTPDLPDAGTPEAVGEDIYNAPAQVGESEMDTIAPVAEEASTASRMIGGGAGALGVIGGGVQFADGYSRATKAGATEQDEVHGGLDMAGGAVAVGAGGLGLATAAGMGTTALLGTTVGALSATAAPVAAAIGLGVAGDHRAEDMDLWGHGSDGKARGTLEAAWDTGMGAGDAVANATGSEALGAAAAGVSTVGLEVGAAAVDVGLGVESLGASSGLFGTAKNDDGKTYNMGAFQALDHAGQAAGSGVDDLLGLDQKSTAGRVVGDVTEGVVDAAGAGVALAADVGGAVVGGVEAAGGWIADFF